MSDAPEPIREFSEQAVAYVRRAVGIALEYDSDTLPLLDHYLRNVPPDQAATLNLVIATAGAYFGEVVRRRLGGRWELGEDEKSWRLWLTTGLNFSPAGFVAAAVAQADLEDLESEFDAPERMRPHIEEALARMSDVSFQDYYSLCGRLDTLEHVHEVLVAVAAKLLGEQDPSAADDGADEEAEGVDPVDVAAADGAANAEGPADTAGASRSAGPGDAGPATDHLN